MNFQTVAPDQLREHPQNPRSHFDGAQLNDLTDSIRAKGILNPLLVRPNGKKGFQILAGARRFRAAQAAGVAEIPWPESTEELVAEMRAAMRTLIAGVKTFNAILERLDQPRHRARAPT